MAYERKADREAREVDEKEQLRRSLDADVERGLLTVETRNGQRYYALTEAGRVGTCGRCGAEPARFVSADCIGTDHANLTLGTPLCADHCCIDCDLRPRSDETPAKEGVKDR